MCHLVGDWLSMNCFNISTTHRSGPRYSDCPELGGVHLKGDILLGAFMRDSKVELMSFGIQADHELGHWLRPGQLTYESDLNRRGIERTRVEEVGSCVFPYQPMRP